MVLGWKLFALSAALLWEACLCHQEYQSMIPNGKKVKRNGELWPMVGHMLNSMERNVFGHAFAANAHIWTQDLCEVDSDGDGQSNGLELGDPDCVWTVGEVPNRTEDISHPGFADSKTSAVIAVTSRTPELAKNNSELAKNNSACARSDLPVSLDGDSENYTCFVQLAPGVRLHWTTTQGGSLHVGLEGRGHDGFISLGFPRVPGKMENADAVFAFDNGVLFYHMDNIYSSGLQAIRQDDLRYPTGEISAVTEGGKKVLRLSDVRVRTLTTASFIWSVQPNCPGGWPCGGHPHTDDFRGGIELDLLSGATFAVQTQCFRISDTASSIALFVVLAFAILTVSYWRLWATLGGGRRCLATPLGGSSVEGVFVCVLVVLGLAALVLIASFVCKADVAFVLVTTTGSASALAALMNMSFSFLRAGIHSAMTVSREVAWRVHAFFGFVFLAVATVHGALALWYAGLAAILDQWIWTAGLVGLVLVWLGVLPLGLFRAGLVRYDAWKVLHLAAPLGYIASIVHIVGFAWEIRSNGIIFLAAANIVLLSAYVFQRIWSVVSSRRCSVVDWRVISEPTGQHVVLTVDAPRFRYSPGQWARLSLADACGVPHPFTVVPGGEQGRIKFIVKRNGRFTGKMLDKDLTGSTVRLDGPYGSPPVANATNWAQAVVFIAGGVGITPVLSQASLARSKGLQVRLFWALRSPGLLDECSPIIANEFPADHRCVHLTGGVAGAVTASEMSDYTTAASVISSAHAETNQNVVVPHTGRGDPGLWLRGISEELCGPDAMSVLVFICGPAGLAAAVRIAVASMDPKVKKNVSWTLHEEEFNFLPVKS